MMIRSSPSSRSITGSSIELITPNADFGISVVNVRDIPPPTAQYIEQEKDPEAYDRRELAKLWKEQQAEFNRLKRLARAIGIESVLVSPYSASPDLTGWYVYCGWEVDSPSAHGWGLSKEQIRSINRTEGPVILIDYYSCFEQGAPHTLAHEIGHHIYRLAEFTELERNASVSGAMRRFFPFDTYVHQSRDEICAECFAKYLAVPTIKNSIKRHCDSILRKVRVHNPNEARLIESYRRQIVSCGDRRSRG